MARVRGVIFAFDIRGIEIERLVDFGQNGQRSRVDDGGDAGDVGEAGDDDLVAGADGQPGEDDAERAGAGVDRDGVARAQATGNLVFEGAHLGLEGRVGVGPVAVQKSAAQDLEDFVDLFLTNQIQARAGHTPSLHSCKRLRSLAVLAPCKHRHGLRRLSSRGRRLRRKCTRSAPEFWPGRQLTELFGRCTVWGVQSSCERLRTRMSRSYARMHRRRGTCT